MELLSAGCFVLMIEISMSGGFGGLPAGGANSTTTLDDMAPARSAAICEAFEPTALSALAEAAPSPGRADTVTYEITVTDDQGPHQFKLDETQLPPEMLDLIDELLHK
jgi:hypothetical protein